MKPYTTPDFELIRVSVEDVIVTSTGIPGCNETSPISFDDIP